MARPRKQVDPKQIELFASIGCKVEEMASLMGVSKHLLHRRFATEIEKGRSKLKMSLRQWQLDAARKGNVVMQIWLGKQYLGQTDKIEESVTQAITQQVVYETTFNIIEDDQTQVLPQTEAQNGPTN